VPVAGQDGQLPPIETTSVSETPPTPLGRAGQALKWLVFGPPLDASAIAVERMRKLVALPVLSADALSSVAYGPQAMLAVLVLAGLLGLSYSLPVGAAIVFLMLAVGSPTGRLNALIRNRARAASLHLDLGLATCFGLMSSFRLGLGLPLDSRGVFAAGLLFGLLDREALCGLPGPREQLVYPRRPVLLRGLLRRGLVFRAGLRAGLRGRPGIQLGCALRRPGFPGVDGGLVLAGEGAFDGLEVCFEFAPPSGCRLRFLVGLRLRFLLWPGMPAAPTRTTGTAAQPAGPPPSWPRRPGCRQEPPAATCTPSWTAGNHDRGPPAARPDRGARRIRQVHRVLARRSRGPPGQPRPWHRSLAAA